MASPAEAKIYFRARGWGWWSGLGDQPLPPRGKVGWVGGLMGQRGQGVADKGSRPAPTGEIPFGVELGEGGRDGVAGYATSHGQLAAGGHGRAGSQFPRQNLPPQLLVKLAVERLNGREV
ncbi:MAG: hypothetical protein IPL28_21290 [Chloroflexi bacterium]|nr:hypothetical protein [Chloroflexota bacterium]